MSAFQSRPTVHLNGTDGKVLLEQNLAAGRAIDRAIEALQAARPHDRDYYVQGPDAAKIARGMHEARLHALADIKHDLSEIARDIRNQLDQRKRK